MKASYIVVAGALGLAALTGCVSVDGTRSQLNSKDPAEVKKAEATIYTIVTQGQIGPNHFDGVQQVEYVKLTSNQELLLKIIDDASSKEVVATAVARLTFSEKGSAKAFIASRLEKINQWGVKEEPFISLKLKIIEKLTQDEVLELLGEPNGKSRDSNIVYFNADDKYLLTERLIEITDSPAVLFKMYRQKINIDYKQEPKVISKMLTVLDKVTDVDMANEMLEARDHNANYLITDMSQRALLISRLPEDKSITRIKNDIMHHNIHTWNKGDLTALETGLAFAGHVKDMKTAIEIVHSVLKHLTEYRAECKKSTTMVWTKDDEAQVKRVLTQFPNLTDTVIAALVCIDCANWEYLKDKVTPESVYKILTAGKAPSDDVEIELIKKLPQAKIDMAVFSGVTTYGGKKLVLASMSDDLKNKAEGEMSKLFDAVIKKAEVARKETFEIHGFYLGMDWADMITVFSRTFPDFELAELKKDGSLIAFVNKQGTPFCRASLKSRKICQFNFGKAILKKWYNYDVQTFMEWAHKYSAETGADMRFKPIEKDTEVYEDDMSRSYRVWFHQESYQYKHNTKEYRLTYFGKENDLTFHGGIGGALIKERAAKSFRHVRGDPGSLRAEIEKD